MDIRATYDQAVIDSWAAKVTAHRRKAWRVQLPIFVVFVFGFALFVFWRNAPAIFLVFGAGAALIFARLFSRAELTCPHCNQPPVSGSDRSSPFQADFCVHCHYWLKSPYANGSQHGA